MCWLEFNGQRSSFQWPYVLMEIALNLVQTVTVTNRWPEFDGRGLFLTITVEFRCQFWQHFTKCLWDFIQKRSKAVIEHHNLGPEGMEAWEHISCLVGWILSWSILLLMFFEICKQIFCYRVAMMILYSYKDDYYKILLWKPRDCTCLGDIPLCFRQQTPRDSFYPWTNKICLEHWRFPFGRCESQRYKWTSLLWWMVNQLSDPISPNVPKTLQCFVVLNKGWQEVHWTLLP